MFTHHMWISLNDKIVKPMCAYWALRFYMLLCNFNLKIHFVTNLSKQRLGGHEGSSGQISPAVTEQGRLIVRYAHSKGRDVERWEQSLVRSQMKCNRSKSTRLQHLRIIPCALQLCPLVPYLTYKTSFLVFITEP